jgi:hypothetical protein
MAILCLLSDQLLMWSAIYVGYLLVTPQAPQATAATTARSRNPLTRFAHRTLQALWQARLQMRQWSWSRSQVLLVGKYARWPASNGLCSSSRSTRCCRALNQLPSGARDHRRNLRDQSRTTSAPRGALGPSGERHPTIAHYSDRFTARRRFACQHAHYLARRRARVATFRGGHQ